MAIIAHNLKLLHQGIRECERLYGREPYSVKLLAVSKKQPIEKIIAAHNAGQKAFGENYLQEALPKIQALANRALEWHFIGPIQRNKTKKIAENFHWVHSIDDITIAERLNDQRPETLPPLDICLEINISHEETKHGIDFDNTYELAMACIQLPRLRLRGLMAIPAPKTHFIDQRAECYKLKLLLESLTSQGLPLDTLSIGMSEDMYAAIAEQATIVRIGTALFGPRTTS